MRLNKIFVLAMIVDVISVAKILQGVHAPEKIRASLVYVAPQ